MEVNGYLFIVDGNSIAPVTSEYVLVTKTAANPHGVDKVWETNILKTDGTTETVDVYVSMNDKHVGPEVGSLYTYRVNLDGDYELIAVPNGTFYANSEVTNFDIQQAYKDGATLNKDVEIVDYQPGYLDYDVTYIGSNLDVTPPTTGYNLAIEVTEQFSGPKGYSVSINDNGTADLPSDDTYTATVGGSDLTVGANGRTTQPGTY